MDIAEFGELKLCEVNLNQHRTCGGVAAWAATLERDGVDFIQHRCSVHKVSDSGGEVKKLERFNQNETHLKIMLFLSLSKGQLITAPDCGYKSKLQILYTKDAGVMCKNTFTKKLIYVRYNQIESFVNNQSK